MVVPVSQLEHQLLELVRAYGGNVSAHQGVSFRHAFMGSAHTIARARNQGSLSARIDFAERVSTARAERCLVCFFLTRTPGAAGPLLLP